MITTALSIIGYTLLVAGLIVCFYWQMRFMVVTYNYGIGWFLACLFIPFAELAFVVLNFRLARKPFIFCLAGFLVAALGDFMARSGWWG